MNNNIISIERKGYCAHYWIGPLGIHVFRHNGAYKVTPWSKWMPKWWSNVLKFSPVWFDWEKEWREK